MNRCTMNGLRLGLVISLFFGSTMVAVHASTVTLNFQGTLTSVNAALTSTYSVGNTFSGSYSYDPTSPQTGSGSNIAIFSGLPNISNLVVNGNTFNFSGSNGSAYVTNSGYDQVAFYAMDQGIGPSVGSYTPNQFLIALTDNTGTSFASTSLPADLTTLVSSFSNSQFNFNFYSNGYAGVGGIVTSAYATVTQVPEPETYAMMLAGIGLICGMVRSRKQKAITV